MVEKWNKLQNWCNVLIIVAMYRTFGSEASTVSLFLICDIWVYETIIRITEVRIIVSSSVWQFSAIICYYIVCYYLVFICCYLLLLQLGSFFNFWTKLISEGRGDKGLLKCFDVHLPNKIYSVTFIPDSIIRGIQALSMTVLTKSMMNRFRKRIEHFSRKCLS